GGWTVAETGGASAQRWTPAVEAGAVHAVLGDADGRPFFATSSGLLHLDDGVLRPVKLPGLEETAVTSLYRDSRDRLWLGLESGGAAHLQDGVLIRPEGAEDLGRSAVVAIAEDQRGRLWFGTDRQGAFRWDGEHWQPFALAQGLPSDTVESLMVDSNDHVWIATFGHGVSQLLTEAFELFTPEHGLLRPEVLAMAPGGDGSLLVGMLKGGMQSFDGKTFSTPAVNESLASPDVTSLLRSRDGALWIGTFRGGVLRQAGGRIERFTSHEGLVHDGVLSLMEDREGRIWISTIRGVSRFDGKDFFNLTPADGLEAPWVYSLTEDAEGGLWMATSGGGIARWDGSSLTHYQQADGLASNRAYAVRQDFRGLLWIATDNGLSRFNGREFTTYHRRHGLGNLNLYLLHLDREGHLWVGGEAGLDRLTLDSAGEPMEIRHYGRDEGFLGIETNQNAIYEDAEGILWIGSRGLARYDRREDREEAAPPRIYLTGLRLFFQPVDWSAASEPQSPWFGLPRDPVLPHDRNHLTFDFLGISRGGSGEILYQYRMDGLDSRWSPPTAQRQAVFSSLPPGEYTFSVRASQDGEHWTEPPASLPLEIRPPFWRAPWFLAFSVCAAALGIYAFDRSRRALALRRQRQLEAEVALRTEQLQLAKEAAEMASRAKSQFLANMTHELK
ncbi:MAG: hypothetical protein KDD47_23350, partial [Acidobacteria bacterium]|nr:hypothetical protein [Acidobacteriota bacterium]